MDTTDEDPLHDVLDDLSYPAEKWQITTCAEIYGADIRTRRTLYALPARTYTDAADIVTAMDARSDRERVTAGQSGQLHGMGRGVARKLIDSHLVDGEAVAGNEVGIRVDQTLAQDAPARSSCGNSKRSASTAPAPR